ncbi:MAG: SCO family protein [Hyphomicrobiaceae bacterium]|nr:SCO family protein [Hyphomicrobiaceae bacterium]
MRLRLVAVIVACFTFGAAAALAVLPEARSFLLAGAPRIKEYGQARVGGPFTLVDHQGKTVSDRDFRGKYMLVTFGFTYCPDVCPGGLQVMAGALDLLGDKGKRITPVFISVDPERDTPAQLKLYVASFHPRLVGLTGTPEQVRAVARAYRVYYAKVEDKKLTSGYTIDHSAITYLMDPSGKFVTHFRYGITPKALAEGLAKVVH